MSVAKISLKREASEKRLEAQTKLDELSGFLRRQVTGELEEGETRLSPEEIVTRKKGIQSLLDEASALEGVDNLDGVMKRDPKDMGGTAREIQQDFTAENGGRKGDAANAVAFKSVGDFLRSVRATTGETSEILDVRMTDQKRKHLDRLRKAAIRFAQGEPIAKELGDMELKTLVGDDDGSAGRGDFLIPTEYMSELLRIMGEQQQFANRARRIPMSRRTVIFPRLAQTTAADTRPIFSFAAVTKIAEAATKPEREPTFEQLSLTAIKYAAYVEASDELLMDSIVDLPPVLIDLLTSAISYEFDRDTMRGAGTTEPQGWIGSDAEYVVNRTTSQEINFADILEMEARFFGTDGIYIFNQSAIPEIYGLAQNNLIVWNRDLTARVPGTLFGREMVRTHKLPQLGVKGDFNLVDPSFYLVGELQAISVASSIHYRFRNDVTAWRAMYRATGAPWPAGPFSMESDGTNLTYEVSPFVVLGDDVTS